MIRIVTATELYGLTTADELHAWLLSRASVIARMVRLDISPEQVGQPADCDHAAPAALAYVNHGSWVADCPREGCGGAIDLVRGAPFLCPHCLNIEIGFRWRMVEWPEQIAEIEQALSKRMLPEQANWRPGESVADLLIENAVHGVGV